MSGIVNPTPPRRPSNSWLMDETDVDKRAAMLNVIDLRRGSSAVSQQAFAASNLEDVESTAFNAAPPP
ncbi:hypothetical protein WJX82_006137 [Trebouxia sp. C0006]